MSDIKPKVSRKRFGLYEGRGRGKGQKTLLERKSRNYRHYLYRAKKVPI